MRVLTITRKKHYAGSLIPYSVLVDVGGKTPGGSLAAHPIRNGETIVLDVPKEACTVRVQAQTSTGPAGSPDFVVPAGEQDAALTLETKYNWIKGSSFVLHESK